MARLALSRDLLNDFAKLEVPVKNRVSALAAQFQRMTVEDLRASKGIHLERHTGAKDKRARTLRISDGTRAIVFDAGDDETFIITRIGNHDETDRWMAKNEFRVNPEVGALEVYDSDAIQPYVDDAGPKAAETEALYAHRSDKEFTKLGVLPDLIPALRAFTNETQLEGLLAVLPENQANALILLTGDEGVDTLYAEVAGSFVPAAAITNDVVAALAGSVPLYGEDETCYDGSNFFLAMGDVNFQVGAACTGDQGSCTSADACVPVPPGLDALVQVLRGLTEQSLKVGDCATKFP